MSEGEETGSAAAHSGDAAFAALGDAVRAALSDRGFSTPTEPQRLAIPPIASGQDALVVAPTGTGKTETAMLPVFDDLAADPPDGFGALYVTPLRALNRDMRDRLEWWGEELDLDVQVRHGDTTQYRRRKQAESPPDVLVTTPETLQAMLTGERLREALEDVSHVVIDEVHELAASKRGAQLAIALERLRALGGAFQRVGLSATVGDPDEVGQFLTGDRGCAVVEVDVGSRLDLTVEQPAVEDGDETIASELVTDETIASHVRRIDELIGAHESTLVFVNTRQTAEALGSRFKAYGTDVGVHHGSLAKEARIQVEDAFKDGELDALLCTSSMELGIDVGHVDHVVQYGSPRQVARLLQRVGRAGHRRDLVSSGTVVTRRADDTLEAAVIARRSLEGFVEPAAIHDGSLDTVANQLAGLVMGVGEAQPDHAYRLLRRAYPFRDLERERFDAVVDELVGNDVLWRDAADGTLSKRQGTWQYFYQNLSMIPDEATYEVEDVASGDQVGTLDEKFVVNFASPGSVFVQGGEMWRITEVDRDEETITVSPIEDPAGEVPSWVGQEIPVPRAVAQEVGELRRVAGRQLRGEERSGGERPDEERYDGERPDEERSDGERPDEGRSDEERPGDERSIGEQPDDERSDGERHESESTDADRNAVARDLANRYPAPVETLDAALERIADHEGPLPTDERVLVEIEGRDVVVNLVGGHKVNETVGRLLAALLGQRAGATVAMEVDPYRIELELPSSLGPADVETVLRETDPAHVEALVELSLRNADSLGFSLAQVAAKFGRLKRWRGSGAMEFGRDRLVDALEDTPVYDEALRLVFHEDLDVDGAADVLEAIQTGDLALETVRGRTSIGRGGNRSGRDLLSPDNADASVIETVKERIQTDDVRLLCLHCEDWERRRPVKRVRDQPECPRCESTRIAALNPWAEEVVSAVRADDKDEEQREMTERAHRSASLVQSHGKQAVIALAARGVGPHNAARIINKLREDEDEFYRDILRREREYARTRSFW